TDNAGNAATMACGSVTVSAGDFMPPTITACGLSVSSLPPAGGTVMITATVSDNVGVTDVTATVDKPDGTTAHVALAHGAGNTWSGTFQAPANSTATAQTYQVSLRAGDASSNSADASCGEFRVTAAAPDLTPPVLSHAVVTPRKLPHRGGTVTLSVTATDDVAV